MVVPVLSIVYCGRKEKILRTKQIEIHGFCDDAFLPFREAFVQNFEDGLEIGASLAVYHRGKLIVDIWAGYADRKKELPWEEDTIVCVFSSTLVLRCQPSYAR
jgi:CubicO group peptidase (beta-lactamase class C family)